MCFTTLTFPILESHIRTMEVHRHHRRRHHHPLHHPHKFTEYYLIWHRKFYTASNSHLNPTFTHSVSSCGRSYIRKNLSDTVRMIKFWPKIYVLDYDLK